VIRTVDLRGQSLDKAGYQAELPRAQLDVAKAMTLIEPILRRVQHGTEADLIALAQEFDGVRPASIRVPQSMQHVQSLTLRFAQLLKSQQSGFAKCIRIKCVLILAPWLSMAEL
jgi:histidinol dehydrogenase